MFEKGRRTRSLLIALVVLVAAMPVSAQTFTNVDPGNKAYTTRQIGIGNGATNPSDLLHIDEGGFNGFNFRLFAYTYLGTVYSSWSTVLGYNVKAATGPVNRMEYAITNGAVGGVAMVMSADGLQFHTAPAPSTAGTQFNSPRMVVTAAGNVGIGTAGPAYKFQVIGDANISGTLSGGNIQATYQDVAEWVPSSEDLSAGTVVVLDTTADNQVKPSSTAYDTKVAGVVSAQPGLLLGVKGESMEMIATTGRVKVRVDASKHPIAIGDLLVSSDRSGVAMKSIPVEIGTVSVHRPGTIIGKALQPLASGEGEILVLLSMQ